MDRTKEVHIINLKGNSNQEFRTSFITNLLNNAESKVNHLDGIRQRNLVVALAVFSGLFSFIMKSPDSKIALSITISLTTIMGMFFLLENRFRQYSRGWQKTKKNMVKCLEDIINNPEKDVSFPKYDISGESEQRSPSIIFKIYIVLILGCIFSFVVFYLSQ